MENSERLLNKDFTSIGSFLFLLGFLAKVNDKGIVNFGGDVVTTDEKVKDTLTMIFKEMRFHGIGCVNYRLVGGDASQMRLFELNPRVCGGLEASIPKYEDHLKAWIRLYAKNELVLMPRPAKEAGEKGEEAGKKGEEVSSPAEAKAAPASTPGLSSDCMSCQPQEDEDQLKHLKEGVITTPSSSSGLVSALPDHSRERILIDNLLKNVIA